MKFWKHSALAAVIFLSIASATTYTSCINDSCKAIMCQNDGVCTDGFCRCPEGFSGTQCEIRERDKFIAVYDGQTKVNNLPVSIDSAVIDAEGTVNETILNAYIYSRLPEKFRGVAVGDEVNVTNAENGQMVTIKWLGTNNVGKDKVEILIDEVVDGERVITNFQGTER